MNVHLLMAQHLLVLIQLLVRMREALINVYVQKVTMATESQLALDVKMTMSVWRHQVSC